MPQQHQWDYLFVIGLLFASMDAYNIGANDVANSFATSIASRSLTLRQAAAMAALFEFLGAVLAGSHVTGTIKNGIIKASVFQDNAGIQLLTFTCAITASATWLMIATRNSWPVSTTYSIVCSLAGCGVALGGGGSVVWGWNNAKGLAAIFGGMVIAPAIAAGFGGITFFLTKYGVLKRKNSIRTALIVSPIYFFGIAAILTMTIIYKGAPQLNLDDLPQTTIAPAIVLTGVGIAALAALFWLPYVHAKVVKKDHTIRFWHFFYGPLLWRRPAPEVESDGSHVPDYRVIREDGTASSASTLRMESPEKKTDPNQADANGHDVEALAGAQGLQSGASDDVHTPQDPVKETKPQEEQIEGAWILPRNLLILAKRIPKILTHGTSIDIHALQANRNNEQEAAALRKVHEHSQQFSNETEHLYSFLQVLTACTNSFAHGSNDTANALGPFAVIYYVWNTGNLASKDTETPVWQYAFMAGMLVIGLVTYGYNCMAVLGNRLTLLSPSRGMSCELGSSITVLLASQYGIPVSTTMCITGSTAGVGLISGGVKALNWRAFAWIYLGWLITVPVAGIAGGCLLGIILNAPKF